MSAKFIAIFSKPIIQTTRNKYATYDQVDIDFNGEFRHSIEIVTYIFKMKVSTFLALNY